MPARNQYPIGSGPAGPAISVAPFKNPWHKGEVVLLGSGDSITSGYGASSGHAYFDLLISNDDAKHPDMQGRDLKHVLPNLISFNYARPCTVSEEHLKEQIPRVKPFSKNVKGIVVITSGGNDLIHDYGRSSPKEGAMYGCTEQDALKWRSNYQKRLMGIIDGVQKIFPGGCEIFIANIYDPTDGVGDIHHAPLPLPPWPDGTKALRIFNQAIGETCAEYPNVHPVDIHSEFMGHGIHCRDKRNKHYRPDDPHYWYFSNLEDPNDRGYDAIRRVFLREMVEVFAK